MSKILKSVWHCIAGDPALFIDSELLSAISKRQALPLQEVMPKAPTKEAPSATAPLRFYPLALLIHADYVGVDLADLKASSPLWDVLDAGSGRLGDTPMKTANMLNNLLGGTYPETCRNFSVFITHKGRFKLEELEKEKLNARRLLFGWAVALGIAMAAALFAYCLRSGEATIECRVSGQVAPLVGSSTPPKESSVR